MINNIIALFLISVFLIAWGIMCYLKYKKWHDKRKNCQKELQVYVKEILEKKTSRGGMVYKPIFVWKEDNKEFIIDSAFYSDLVSFKVGEAVNLLVNPNNYLDYIYAENTYNKGLVLDIGACFIPLIFVLGIVLAIIVK